MTVDPRPCPCCGRLAIAHQARWEGERSTVQCRPCHIVMGGAPREPLHSIVQRWNTRPEQAANGAPE